MRILLVVLLVHACAFAQAEQDSLKGLAEQVLISGCSSNILGQEAAWALSLDPARGLEIAATAAQHKNWLVRLSALAIWNSLGPDTVLQCAVGSHALHQDPNWLVRQKTLEACAGLNDLLTLSLLQAALTDVHWSVRLAGLKVLAAADVALNTELLGRVVALTGDADRDVAHMSWRILIRSAGRDRAAALQLHQRPWEKTLSTTLKRKALWAGLDGAARGFLPPGELPDRGQGVSWWRRCRAIILAPSGVDRVAEVIDLLADNRADRELGEELCRALVRHVAADEDWLDVLFPVHVRDTHRRALFAAIKESGVTPSLKVGVLSALCGYEKMDEVLLDAAFESRPASLPRILEEMFVGRAKEGSSRRQLRRILKFRLLLDPPISDSFVIESLRRGGFARRVITAEQMWRRSSEEMRRTLVAFMPRLESDRKTYRALVRILAETPRQLAAPLYLDVVASSEFSRNDRLMALNALTRLQSPISVPLLTALLADRTPADLRDRATRMLVDRGHEPTRTMISQRLRSSDGSSFDLLTLNHALGCNDPSLVEHIQAELAAGRFTSSTLVPMLSFIKKKAGRAALDKVLSVFFESARSRTDEGRRHTGFERLDGSVLEHILTHQASSLPLKAAFDLLQVPSIENKDRLLIGMVEYAQKRGETSELVGMMKVLWDDLAAGTKDVKQRAFLARPLVLTGETAGRTMVVAWLRAHASQLLSRNSEREDVWYGVVALDEILGSLIQEGSSESIVEVFRILAALEKERTRDLLRDSLAQVAQEADDDEETTLFLAGTLAAIGKSRRSMASLQEAWQILVAAPKETPLFPLRFWAGWARLSVRFPEHNQPSSFIADRLLELGVGNMDDNRLLLTLGRRSIHEETRGDTARLYRRGRMRERMTVSSPSSDAARSELWRFRSPPANALMWTDMRARAALGGKVPGAVLSWAHRHHDEEMSRLVVELHSRGQKEDAWRVFNAALRLTQAEGLWLTTELRLLLDEKRFVEAEKRALAGSDRVFAFGTSSRLGSRRAFLCYQAAALWGQGKKSEARSLLKKAGVDRLDYLEGPVPWDFPGY